MIFKKSFLKLNILLYIYIINKTYNNYKVRKGLTLLKKL